MVLQFQLKTFRSEFGLELDSLSTYIALTKKFFIMEGSRVIDLLGTGQFEALAVENL